MIILSSIKSFKLSKKVNLNPIIALKMTINKYEINLVGLHFVFIHLLWAVVLLTLKTTGWGFTKLLTKIRKILS